MINKNLFAFLALVTLFLFSINSVARPEYAVKHGIVNCTGCHASPTGGGIRNTNGKLYGLRNQGFSKRSLQDLYQLDARFYGLFPEEPKLTSHGINIMNVIGSFNIPVTGEGEVSGTNFVASYGFGGFTDGLRDGYIKWRLGHNFLKNIVFGQFNVPFGLLSDEHRTFTRIQTKTSTNDFYKGVMVSGQLFMNSLHYDLVLTNNYGKDETSDIFWGSYANLRWAPAFLPLSLGTSLSYHEREQGKSDPRAQSVYAALSLNRITNSLVKGAILTEWVSAKHYNDVINLARITEYAPLLSQVIESRSEGYYVQLTWDLTPKWTLMYKYDSLALDQSFAGDAFVRHGVGFRYFATSNLTLITRAEFSSAGNEDVPDSDAGNQDTYYALAHLWF